LLRGQQGHQIDRGPTPSRHMLDTRKSPTPIGTSPQPRS
jgi:hypothetical protein